jgi:hypothetical protein
MSVNDMRIADWPKGLKQVTLAFLVTLTIGVSLGLAMVWISTSATPDGVVGHYRGDDPTVIELIPEKYPMPVKELLITTHNHILSFTMIFGVLGVLIQFSRKVPEKWVTFLSVEPFLSIVFTFGSMWGIRFVHDGFVWLMFLSSSFMYLSFYTMIFIIIRELLPLSGNNLTGKDRS